MEQHALGSLWPVSTPTLGDGGLGMLWGPTTFDECVATVLTRSLPASICSIVPTR
jgi:hypothetical protein